MLNQTIDPTQLAAAISAHLNEDIPASQVKRAIKRYDMSFMPGWRTQSHTFTAVSVLSGTKTINLDGGYGYFFNAIAGVHVAAAIDTDVFLQSIQINSGNNFVPDPLPFALLTRFTGKPLEFCFYAPPNTALQTEFKNGATTAAVTLYLTYFGYKLPAGTIEKIKSA